MTRASELVMCEESLVACTVWRCMTVNVNEKIIDVASSGICSNSNARYAQNLNRDSMFCLKSVLTGFKKI